MALFNHSCSPNCILYTDKNVVKVCVTKPVKEGEELTFAYIDIYQVFNYNLLA